MTEQEAIDYVNMRFEYETELRSYAQDKTCDGVFTKDQFQTFDKETQIDIAEDLKYQFKQEFGYLFQ